MNTNTTSLLIVASVFGSAMVAMRLRAAMPAQHLSDATKDTVKLTMGLVATMSALVLGLLVASTKGAYDTEKNEVTQLAAKIIYLDRVLVNYGPDAAGARKILHDITEKAIGLMWPDESATPVTRPPSVNWTEILPASIQKLAPQNDDQRAARSQAAQLATDLGQMRWLLFEQQESSISVPMLVIVATWLSVLFFSFGLFAPPNPTAIGALLVGAISVSLAIFLVLEMDQPFSGIIHISSDPMRHALQLLGGAAATLP